MFKVEYFSIWRRRWENPPQEFPLFKTEKDAKNAISGKVSELLRDQYRIVYCGA